MLHVDKVDSLQTEKVHISASGLEKVQCYKFYLKFHYFAGAYHSYCVVQSDENGNIDLARDKPIRGTYHEIDPMGLFLTLQPSQEVRFGHNAGNNKAKPFYYTLQLISNSGIVLDQKNLRKLWIHPRVTPIEVAQNSIHGVIFKPPGPGPFPCISDVPGINGGQSYGRAALFSAEGYLVYTLASFGYKDLPKKMEDVDLEVFSKHVKFVQSLPYCSEKIGLYGMSFGGTIANYLATKHPEISAIAITNVPEAFYRDLAVMKENGNPMECEKIDKDLEVWINRVKRQTPSFLDLFSRLRPDTSIKWERISKDIPFRIVASLDDWLLCGVTNCKRIQENLVITGHKVEIQLVPGGHVMYAPYLPHVSVGYNKYHKFYLGYGGECSLETKSMINVWEKTLKFFEKHLGSPAKLPDYKREIEIVLPSRESKL
ncbi:hypothetical protein CAEBREN_08594 [Caenorhabditis brenneri]|uniref:BAAT/Acyl-CoA thioester hydrolase C-terminal domain-containing protein n=1 Tax=Caenorhabditis brenneri TaxID=135651 RepID=G0M9K5_CAEBE|nr:hypothetical protein CAEBREN_08594 [Caenorhabditis brenneri]